MATRSASRKDPGSADMQSGVDRKKKKRENAPIEGRVNVTLDQAGITIPQKTVQSEQSPSIDSKPHFNISEDVANLLHNHNDGVSSTDGRAVEVLNSRTLHQYMLGRLTTMRLFFSASDRNRAAADIESNVGDPIGAQIETVVDKTDEASHGGTPLVNSTMKHMNHSIQSLKKRAMELFSALNRNRFCIVVLVEAALLALSYSRQLNGDHRFVIW
jgi:hypothetical protein